MEQFEVMYLWHSRTNFGTGCFSLSDPAPCCWPSEIKKGLLWGDRESPTKPWLGQWQESSDSVLFQPFTAAPYQQWALTVVFQKSLGIINSVISSLELTKISMVCGIVLPAVSDARKSPLCCRCHLPDSLSQSHSPRVAWDMGLEGPLHARWPGQVKRRPSSHPSSVALTPPLPPVNTSLSDGKVNKFCSRLKVLIISFVNDK